MRYVLMGIIRLYWLIPKSKRRKCIFRESCSHHVFTILKEKGLKAGIKAIKQRYHQCRPGQIIFSTHDGREWVLLKDNSVIERSFTTV